MDRDHWRNLAARHTRSDAEPRRCRDCAACWPCDYRQRADRELNPHRFV
ncbi:hypothetical protein ABT336_11785 [Micromonospora sp. NPDC000207]